MCVGSFDLAFGVESCVYVVGMINKSKTCAKSTESRVFTPSVICRPNNRLAISFYVRDTIHATVDSLSRQPNGTRRSCRCLRTFSLSPCLLPSSHTSRNMPPWRAFVLLRPSPKVRWWMECSHCNIYGTVIPRMCAWIYAMQFVRSPKTQRPSAAGVKWKWWTMECVINLFDQKSPCEKGKRDIVIRDSKIFFWIPEGYGYMVWCVNANKSIHFMISIWKFAQNTLPFNSERRKKK